jgi:para-aminobenzoate synthetase / 4-amino-4-deoxychorismate lyase
MGTTPEISLIYDAERKMWLCFSEPLCILETSERSDVLPLLQSVEREVQEHGFYAAGFISYEAASALDSALQTRGGGGFPLVRFGVFKAPKVLSALPLSPSRGYRLDRLTPSISREQYLEAVRSVREHIREGDTYQVNYTLRLSGGFEGDALSLFHTLLRAQSCSYGAFIETDQFAICSSSPELFFHLKGDRITTSPMKGTASRGKSLREDQAQMAWLSSSEKNRAENVMIVDMMRNDLGRIANVGSVEVPSLCRVEKYPTVLQMTSTVQARTSASFVEIISALFPSASITGAPKARTMEIIAGLEQSPRKLYTGTIGYLAPHRTAQFNVAIRTAVIEKRDGVLEYGVGGGITWDSTPEEEYKECLVKSLVITETYPEFSLLETMLWEPGKGFFLLQHHLDRLRESAEYFSIPLDVDVLTQELASGASRWKESPMRVRLLIATNGQSRLEVTPLRNENSFVTACLARGPVKKENLFLYHKTTSRGVYDEALRAVSDVDDVILWNENRELTESSKANIVILLDGEYWTPPVSSGCLPGTFRRSLIDSGMLRERVLKVEELHSAEEVFLINAVRKWMRVQLIDVREALPDSQEKCV